MSEQKTGKDSASKDAKTASETPSASPAASDESQTQTPVKTSAAKPLGTERAVASGGASTLRPTDRRESSSAAGGGCQDSGQRGGRPASPRDGKAGRRPLALIIAAVALIVALIGLLGTGYIGYRGQQRLSILNGQVDDATDNVQAELEQELAPHVSQLDDRVGQLANQLGQVSVTEHDRGQTLDTLAQSLDQLRHENAQLQSALDGDHEAFVEQRILALLEAANERLTIYHDPTGAKKALQAADTAIAHTGYARLNPVREDIAAEMTKLNALPNPDIDGLALQLSKLADQVPTWPIASHVPSTYHNGHGQDDTDTSASSADCQSSDSGHAGWGGIDWQGHWQRLRDTVGSALTHMVTVRRANGTDHAPALMAPDQSYFLVQNLQLELRISRVALLDHQGKAYRASLAEATDWIKRYYNTRVSQTQAALATLNKLSQVELDWQAPDISPSLETMRRLASQTPDNAAAARQNDDDATKENTADRGKAGA